MENAKAQSRLALLQERLQSLTTANENKGKKKRKKERESRTDLSPFNWLARELEQMRQKNAELQNSIVDHQRRLEESRQEVNAIRSKLTKTESDLATARVAAEVTKNAEARYQAEKQ